MPYRRLPNTDAARIRALETALNNEEFSNILNKLSKYYGRKIVWTKGVEKLHGSGTLNLKDDIFKLLKGLEAAAPITFTPKSDEIFVDVKP